MYCWSDVMTSMPDRLVSAIPRLVLRPLSPADANAYWALVQKNRAHLTRFGDYQELVSFSLDEIKCSLVDQPHDGLNMGIRYNNDLIGIVALNPVKPGVYVLGYWIDAEHTGKGYATESCRMLIDYALQNLVVSELWAGIRHANQASIRVAEKLGFKVYERLPDRCRWWIDCSEFSQNVC